MVIGVTVTGERDIFRLWAGVGSAGATFWLAVLTEINNRSVEDVCIAVCDGLKGLPESINTTCQYAKVQAAILHLMRNTFGYTSRTDWDELARDLRPVYTAPGVEMAGVRFEEFADKWGAGYPAVITLWRSGWEEFIVFDDYDVEIRKIICSTNPIVIGSPRTCPSCSAQGRDWPGPGLWMWLSTGVHDAEVSEERCWFKVWCDPPRGASRGRCSGTTTPRWRRSSAIWPT